MSNIKYILFDCMETLIDFTELPEARDYAMWSFVGSGVETLWGSFEEFFTEYALLRKNITKNLPMFKDYSTYEYFKLLAELKLPRASEEDIEKVARKLCENYWKNYTSRCYVRDETIVMLSELSKNFRLGVVSNFRTINGIEELLERNHILEYFNFVVTSIKEGWRKPHPNIYVSAIEKTGVLPQEILFVGNDYLNDYMATKDMGMKSVLLDRYMNWSHIDERLNDFYELTERIFKYS